jgi:hypothetical protein
LAADFSAMVKPTMSNWGSESRSVETSVLSRGERMPCITSQYTKSPIPTRSCSRHKSTLFTMRGRPPRKYSIHADVSTMTISVPSHFIEIAFPGDLAFEGAKISLAVDLYQQSQACLDRRTLRATTAGAQGARHQPVINNYVCSHNTPPSCVRNVHILGSVVKPQRRKSAARFTAYAQASGSIFNFSRTYLRVSFTTSSNSDL